MARKKIQDSEPVDQDNQIIEEGSSMNTENQVMENEFEAGQVDPTTEGATEAEGTEGTEAPAGDAAEAKKFYDAEGKECSMSAFIKRMFNDGMSRADIAEKYDINYRTVYGATLNMDNGTVTARGRSQTITTVTTVVVDGEEKVLTFGADNVVLLDNVASTITKEEIEALIPAVDEVGAPLVDPETNEQIMVLSYEHKTYKRDEFIAAQVAAGVAKKVIAAKLDVSYGVIHNATKSDEPSTRRHTVTVVVNEETGETKEVPRAEHIRNLVAGGMEKSEVAKQLGVDYSVVWQACNQASSDQEKFTKNVEALEKMADKVDGEEAKAAFLALIEQLKATPIVADKEEEGTDEAPEAPEATETEVTGSDEAPVPADEAVTE